MKEPESVPEDPSSTRRIIRFESGGPAPATVLDRLVGEPPAGIAGQPVRRIVDRRTTQDGANATGAVEVVFDDGSVFAAPGHRADELEIVGAAETSGSLDRLEATAALLADPERREFRQALVAAQSPDAAPKPTPPQAPRERSTALRQILRCVDLTTLAGDDTPGRVRALCAIALRPDPADPSLGPTAAVCVYAAFAPLALELTRGTDVAVAAVAAGFPAGLASLSARQQELDDLVAMGIDEVDVVLNRSRFLAGDLDGVKAELAGYRGQLGDTPMKVILEVDELGSSAAITLATRLAIEAGADWVKTSTGKTGRGATPEAVRAMATEIAQHHEERGAAVGIKISGGVRTADEALDYWSIVETVLGPDWMAPSRLRFGASSLVGAIVTAVRGDPQS